MDRLIGLVGLVVMLLLAWAISSNRRRVPWRIVLVGLGLQLGFGLIVFKTPLHDAIIGGDGAQGAVGVVDAAFQRLLKFAEEGGDFVFASFITNKVEDANINIVVRILPTVIFFSALMALLYHLGIMQLIVRAVAWVMRWTMGTSGSETLSCSANIFVGQTEAPLMVRPFVKGMTKSELLTVMTGGFATVAGGVMALYVGWLQGAVPGIAGHLLTASVMSAPAAIVIAKLMLPETEVSETAGAATPNVEKLDDNAVEALARGATEGMKLAINIAAMLIAFVAVLAMVNWALGATYDWCQSRSLLPAFLSGTRWSLEALFGWLFYPLAIVMGAEPGADAHGLGRLLGEKVVLTELIAYKNLAAGPEAGLVLTERTKIIASYALCGFANFASVGIQLGGIGAMAPERRKDLAKLALRALLAGALASWTTACIAGVLA